MDSHVNLKTCIRAPELPDGAGKESARTTMLIAMRASIVWWVTLSLTPIEVVFDAIESELARRGVPL